jgi:hypothetical protein
MKKKICAVFLAAVMCAGLCGCESLVKKFARKPKEPQTPREVLISPEDYGNQKPAAKELYDRYYLYWKSWQDEFILSLSGASRKRRTDTVAEALRNLAEMRKLLDEQSRQLLDVHIRELELLGGAAERDIYSMHRPDHTAEAEKIRRQIMNGFSLGRVKDHLL